MTLSGDRRVVSGSETVRTAFDKSVTELVFRLWPSGPISAAKGGRLTVTSVSGVAVARTSVEQRGTLYRIALRSAVKAGSPVTVTLGFTLRLPIGANERWGTRSNASWWGSGFPLLAWEPGRGWAQEPPTSLFAEAATSEVFRLDRLTVNAPTGDTVLATGVLASRSSLSGGRTRWVFRADAVRDVAVASGRFTVVRGTGAGGVPVTVGVAAGMTDSPRAVLRATLETFGAHVAHFGPFPYPALSVPVIPDVNGGIEFPGLFYLGHNQLDATPSHELAHEWFYGLVGDDQARDPWLDESFATYAEAIARGTGAGYRSTPIPAAGLHRVGEPMTFWEAKGERVYYRSVYVQGAAALLRARERVGSARFDAALRCYVRSVAHRIARPADLQAALSGLPAALGILRTAGAF
jgi:hypothetical protein